MRRAAVRRAAAAGPHGAAAGLGAGSGVPDLPVRASQAERNYRFCK